MPRLKYVYAWSDYRGLSDGLCGLSQEGGEWHRTNTQASSSGPKADHTDATGKASKTSLLLINSDNIVVSNKIQSN